MWIPRNPNPLQKNASDCVIRAIGIALNRSWYEIYDELCALGRKECNMPSADVVWGLYLYQHGFEPVTLPKTCPRCITIREFTEAFPKGTYIVGTGSHAVAVIDGDYHDSHDSGNELASFFWKIQLGERGEP